MEELKFMDFTNVPDRPRIRVGCCRYDKKINSIIIEVHRPGRFEYDVDLDRNFRDSKPKEEKC